MKDLAYAFTIYFVTLGPLKTIPAFFLATQGADRRTILTPAARSTIVATLILLFAGLALGDLSFRVQLLGLLLAIMAANFLAMLSAGPILRRIGLPLLQIVGWVFSALQAGLAIQTILDALRSPL